ncbi:hypothetical protein PCE1_004916 [Barthelona sp. PCE]
MDVNPYDELVTRARNQTDELQTLLNISFSALNNPQTFEFLKGRMDACKALLKDLKTAIARDRELVDLVEEFNFVVEAQGEVATSLYHKHEKEVERHQAEQEEQQKRTLKKKKSSLSIGNVIKHAVEVHTIEHIDIDELTSAKQLGNHSIDALNSLIDDLNVFFKWQAVLYEVRGNETVLGNPQLRHVIEVWYTAEGDIKGFGRLSPLNRSLINRVTDGTLGAQLNQLIGLNRLLLSGTNSYVVGEFSMAETVNAKFAERILSQLFKKLGRTVDGSDQWEANVMSEIEQSETESRMSRNPSRAQM